MLREPAREKSNSGPDLDIKPLNLIMIIVPYLSRNPIFESLSLFFLVREYGVRKDAVQAFS